jgi:transposase-like protein DUF772
MPGRGSGTALCETGGRSVDPPGAIVARGSERQLIERLEFDLLSHWLVGLSIDEKVFDASTFSKNRDRLLTHEVAQGFVSRPAGGEGSPRGEACSPA